MSITGPRPNPAMEQFGLIIAEQTQKVIVQNQTAWENVLRLHLKPKPSWMPQAVWVKVVGLVLHQTEQRAAARPSTK